MSYAVQHFFANGGGRAVIVRVMTRTDTGGIDPAAWATLDLGGGNTLAAAASRDLGPKPQGLGRPCHPGRTRFRGDTDDKLFNLTLFDDPEPVAGMSRGGSGQREIFEKVSMDAASPRFVDHRSRGAVATGARHRSGRGAARGNAHRYPDPRVLDVRERRRFVGGLRRRGRERPEAPAFTHSRKPTSSTCSVCRRSNPVLVGWTWP